MKYFFGGETTEGWRDSLSNTHLRYIMSDSLFMFTAPLGLTLINANQKQISFTLMHYLS